VISLAVLISGSGSNLRALLEATTAPDSPAKIIAVGADVEASGLDHAREFGVDTFVVSPKDFTDRALWGQALLEAVQATGPDLVVCAGFMRILPAGFVQALTPNLINMHPALLPLFPGAHAVRDALAAGATETGATVHVVDEGVDTGPVIRQVALDIEPGETEEHLHDRIKTIERKLIVDTVFDIAHNRINLKELARS
jgi:phosphoribosylglycinamide formyltransferase-1